MAKKKAEKKVDYSNANWVQIDSILSQINHIALQHDKLQASVEYLKKELDEAIENKPVEVDPPTKDKEFVPTEAPVVAEEE